MYNLSNVLVFSRVAEAKGFTRAAHELGLSPSAVSRQVSKLEDDLGVQLFVRSTRHVRLTDAGHIFYEGCARGLSEIEAARNTISKMSAVPRGLIRVCLPPCFGRLHVVPTVPDFLELHEHVELEVVLGYSDASMIGEGIDILVRSADLPDSSLSFEDLAPVRHIACATGAYLAKHGAPKEPKDLVHHNCLVLTTPHPKTEWNFVGAKRNHRVHVGGNFRANDTEALSHAVMSGLGIARIPNYVISAELESGALRPVFAKGRGNAAPYAFPATTVKAYYPRGQFASPKIVAFINFLKARFQPYPKWMKGPDST